MDVASLSYERPLMENCHLFEYASYGYPLSTCSFIPYLTYAAVVLLCCIDPMTPKVTKARQLGASCLALVRQRKTSAEEDALKRLRRATSTASILAKVSNRKYITKCG